MLITGLYAGILGLFYIALSALIIATRFQKRVSLGDGGDRILNLRIRAHGNFIEYVPLALILMAALETQGTNPSIIYGLGVALLAGRAAHAIGITRTIFLPRVCGTILTLGTILVASIIAIIQFVW